MKSDKQGRRNIEDVLRFYNRRRVIIPTDEPIKAMEDLKDLEKEFLSECLRFNVSEADLSRYAAEQYDLGIKRWGKPKSGRDIRDAVRKRCPWIYDEDTKAQVVPKNHKEHAVGSMSQYAKRQISREGEG